jgi:membrane protease YdiL (CAAX protease family)
MEAAPIQCALKPFALTVLSVLGIEYAAGFLPMEPLAATGIIRALDIALILCLTRLFGKDVLIPGVIPAAIAKGLKKGILWSAGFGGLAALAGIALYLSGTNPLAMVHVELPKQSAQLLLFFLVAGIIGPVAEELLFRGIVFGFLRRWGASAAIIGSSLLFVAAHHIRGGIPVPQAVGGLLFAISYETEKNLMVPMVIHVSGNMTLFALSLLH